MISKGNKLELFHSILISKWIGQNSANNEWQMKFWKCTSVFCWSSEMKIILYWYINDCLISIAKPQTIDAQGWPALKTIYQLSLYHLRMTGAVNKRQIMIGEFTSWEVKKMKIDYCGTGKI